MTTYLPRSAWTKVPKPSGLVAMPSKPRGVAIHWPGTTAAIGHRTQANTAARLEGYRRFHVNGRGWTDIAYQTAIDQDGRVWDLRGIEHQSAANGDQTVNRQWLACLFLLGPGETPSGELLAAFADWRTRALGKYRTATRIVGHRDIRPSGTTCPGPITENLIRTDALLGDDMPSLDDIAHAVAAYDQDGKRRQWWSYAQTADANARSAARDSAAALEIVKALAAHPTGLTAAEIEAAAERGAKAAIDAEIDSATVQLNVTKES